MVVFHPESDYVGSAASLTITTNDQGYLGSGGPQEDSDSVAIELTAVPAFADSPSHATIPAALDTSFGTDGMQVLSVSDSIDYIRSLKLLASGKILGVGAVNNHFGLLRFNSDLSLDTSFGTDGVVQTPVGEHAFDVIEHPEGGLLVVGKDNLIRYTDDGALDTSFGTNGIADGDGRFDWGRSVAITADGRIVVGGDQHGGSGVWWRQAYFSLSGDFLGGDNNAYQSRNGSAKAAVFIRWEMAQR